jgi:hypothetical protein
VVPLAPFVLHRLHKIPRNKTSCAQHLQKIHKNKVTFQGLQKIPGKIYAPGSLKEKPIC